MTQEEKRIKIAESSQGRIELYDGVWYYWSGTTRLPCKDNDPFLDLNAIREAEGLLKEPQFQSYLDWLDVSCGGELELSAMIEGSAFGFGIVHANAAQRAEAFGLTLGLWES